MSPALFGDTDLTKSLFIKRQLKTIGNRVPTLDVSAIDLTARLAKETTYEEICKAMKEASEGSLKGYLAYTKDEVVSSDFIGNPYTAIFDEKAGIQLSPAFVKVVAWYDSEWGFSCKVLDSIASMKNVNG